MPVWGGKLYQGDHVLRAIVRSQDNERIDTDDPQFSEFYCTSGADLQKLYENMLKCEKWGE